MTYPQYITKNIRISARRKYGRATFTWIEVFYKGDWRYTDPTQKIKPSRKDIQATLKTVQQTYQDVA